MAIKMHLTPGAFSSLGSEREKLQKTNNRITAGLTGLFTLLAYSRGQLVNEPSTYEALVKEVRRLKRGKRGMNLPAFFEEYVYGHLEVLDLVSVIGGSPISVLKSDKAATLLEHPITRAIMIRILALMRVSDDWETFQHLYTMTERPTPPPKNSKWGK